MHIGVGPWEIYPSCFQILNILYLYVQSNNNLSEDLNNLSVIGVGGLQENFSGKSIG